MDSTHAAQLGRSIYNDVAKVHIVGIPRKVYLPKIKSIYAPEAKYDDVDENNFIFKQYCKAVFRSKTWDP